MNTLDNLPNINFAQKDSKLIETELINYFEQNLNRTLYPADPMRLLLLCFVKYISLQRDNIDFSAKQNLLKYSTDGFIENIGALVGVNRLKSTYAVTTLKFCLSMEQQNTVIIPKGTRATTEDGNLYFATLEDVEIKAGKLEIETKAQCTTIGAIGNNYYPNQINRLVDRFGYLCNVCNTTLSAGGTDLEELENFRERIRIAPESFSTAGPDGAYIYWTKTASQLISDVSVVSPNPGDVEIIPLLENGELPTQDILDKVYETCNDRTRRPLTDRVIVRKPEITEYDINLKYYINRSNASIGLSIQDNINKAVSEYILWQKSKLGRDLNPSELTRQLVNAGAKRVEIISPKFTKLRYFQVAISKTITITYGGIEDD